MDGRYRRYCIRSILGLLVLVLLTGCAQTRTITIEETPPSSLNTHTDSSIVSPVGRVALRDLAQPTYPTEVNIFDEDLESVSYDVHGITIDSESVIITTGDKEIVYQAPVEGERLIVYPDTSFLEGEPATITTEFEVPIEKRRSWIDSILFSVLKIGGIGLLIAFILALIYKAVSRFVT